MKRQLEFTVFIKLLSVFFLSFAVFVGGNSYLSISSEITEGTDKRCQDKADIGGMRNYKYVGGSYSHPNCYYIESGQHFELGGLLLLSLSCICTFLSLIVQCCLDLQASRTLKLVDGVFSAAVALVLTILGSFILLRTASIHELSYYAVKDREVKTGCKEAPEEWYELGYDCDTDEPFIPIQRDLEVVRGKTGYYGKITSGHVGVLASFLQLFTATHLLLSAFTNCGGRCCCGPAGADKKGLRRSGESVSSLQVHSTMFTPFLKNEDIYPSKKIEEEVKSLQGSRRGSLVSNRSHAQGEGNVKL